MSQKNVPMLDGTIFQYHAASKFPRSLLALHRFNMNLGGMGQGMAEKGEIEQNDKQSRGMRPTVPLKN